MKFQQTPGQQIKLARVRKGLTQQQVVDMINELLPSQEIIERTMLSRWEKDNNYPRNSRRSAIEKVLSIKLVAKPVRRETHAAYLTSQDNIVESITSGLKDCSELWLTSIPDNRAIWFDQPEVRKTLEALRSNPNCKFKELFYLRSLEDFKFVRKIISNNYPNYSVRIRVAPGHPFPVMVAPGSKFGIFLSGFSDDMTTVALELDGQISGFNEHYLHRIWLKATAIYEYGEFNKEKFNLALQVLEDLGGVANNEFEHRQ